MENKQPEPTEPEVVEVDEATQQLIQEQVEILLNDHCRGDAEILVLRLQNLNKLLKDKPGYLELIDNY